MQDLRALGKRAAGVMPGPECSGTERAGGVVGSRRAATLATVASFLVLASQLGGCSSTRVAARERPPVPGPSGNTWELVLESPSASAISYAANDRPEMTRRNDSMNIMSSAPTLATDRWPEDPRPNLRYDRRIYLPTDARSYQYFDSSYRSTYRRTDRVRYWNTR